MRKRFDKAEALPVAANLRDALAPFCHRIEIVGSIRRGKQDVSDGEILYVPKIGDATEGELFATPHNLANIEIKRLLQNYTFSKRTNRLGHEMFGEKNKFLRHTLTGVPIDLFETTEENWYTSLVIRTGGKETNLQLTTAAQRMGYTLHAHGSGYTRLSDGEKFPMRSEAEVFAFLNLPCPEPKFRA